jgi:mRNA interferase MazF
MKRGDVVIVDWLFRPSGSGKAKPRPALVVQNNLDNARLTNTILVMITSVTRRALEPTQLLIELAAPGGKRTGLRQDSVINCVNLLTVEQNKVIATIGDLSPAQLTKIDVCLKLALGLP